MSPVRTLQHALNAVVLELTAEEAARIAQNPNVELVEREEILPLHTYAGPAFIGAAAIWNGTATGVASKGEGMLVGIIDTGINFDSEAFASTGPRDGYVHVNPLGEGNYLGTCAAGGPDAGNCNSKLIGAYNLTTNATAKDTNGHGSHTASTAAGNAWNATVNGLPFTISGVAPHANLIAYKACPTDGCPNIATTAAVNQAILDGVDAINFSIGGGTSPWSNTPSIAFRNAAAAGIFVAASAGNDGPDLFPSEHLEPWTETVAASSHDRRIGALLSLDEGSAQTQDIVVLPGATPWPAAPQVEVPVVESPGFANGSTDGCTAFPADTFVRAQGNPDIVFNDSFEDAAKPPQGRVGAIAVLRLDGDASNCTSGTRRTNALAAGAVGVIFVDDEYLNLGATGTTWAMLDTDWTTVKSAFGSAPTLSITTVQSVPAEGDVLADFSSRGPSELPDGQVIIKPEIAAPGVNILAAVNGEADAAGLISGTSMASPHVAGAALLLRALNPTLTPMQIKSALNLTADKSGMVDYNHDPVGPFQVGSGRAALADAARAGLVMDETAANFVAANPATGGDVSSLNLAQFANSRCVGTCSFTRSFRRARTGAQTYAVAVSGLPAGSFSLSTQSFTINATGTRTLELDVRGDLLPPGWAFGEVTLTPASGNEPVLRLPIAVNAVGPIIEVTPASISATGSQTVQLQIANAGNPTLDWQLETDSINRPIINSTFESSGQLVGHYAAIDTGVYWLQNFDVGAAGTRISLLRANGFVLPGGTLLGENTTTSVSFEIFDDGANPGEPAGAPEGVANGFGAPARWSYTAAIDEGGVTGADGFLTLDLSHPDVPALDLPAGRYWLAVYPNMIGQISQTDPNNPLWAWYYSPDAQIGDTPVVYSPTQDPDAFGNDLPSTVLMSARVDGSVGCALPSWLQVAPQGGSLGLGGSQNVAVTFDSTGVPAGVHEARICITSNAVNEPELEIPVTFTVPSTPFVEKAFAPSSVGVGASPGPRLTIKLNNPTATAAVLTSDLVDTLPAGLAIGLVANASTTCTGGNVTTTANSVSLLAGASIPANGSCSVGVDIDSPANVGSFLNALPAGSLQTSAGTNADAASATLEVTAPQTCSTQLFQDPSFEATQADGSNHAWASTSTSSRSGTSLCTDNLCGGTHGRTGLAYIWFGGLTDEFSEIGTATQSVVIPAGAPREVNFWMRRGAATAADVAMTLSIDGNVLQTYPAVAATEAAYSRYTVAIPAQYANGASHAVQFRFAKAAAGSMGSHFVDDVTLDCPQPSLSAQFADDIVDQTGTTTLTIDLDHPFAANATLTGAFDITLAAGLRVAAVPDARSTCGMGVVTAVAGAQSISLAAGARIPPAGCSLEVDVQVTGTGIVTQTIPAGALHTDYGNSIAGAAASLRSLATTQDDDYGFEAAQGFNLAAINGQQGFRAGSAPLVSALRPSAGTQHLLMTSSATAPQVFTPKLVTGAGRYSVVGARLRISRTTNGASWQLQPQDTLSGVLAARVVFDRAVARSVQVVEFDPVTGAGALVPTTGTWPIGTYFTFEMIFDRQTGTLQLCQDNVSIYSGANAYVSGLIDEMYLTQSSNGTTGNTLDVDNLSIGTNNVGGCGSSGVTGAGPTPSSPVLRDLASPDVAIERSQPDAPLNRAPNH